MATELFSKVNLPSLSGENIGKERRKGQEERVRSCILHT